LLLQAGIKCCRLNRKIVFAWLILLHSPFSVVSVPHLGLRSRLGQASSASSRGKGYAAPIDFTGEVSTKEGMIPLAPGSTAKYSMRSLVEG
jgi:hypothetical protein